MSCHGEKMCGLESDSLPFVKLDLPDRYQCAGHCAGCLTRITTTAHQRGFHAETGPLRADACVLGTCLVPGGCGIQLQVRLSACASLTMQRCLSTVSLDKVKVLLNDALPWHSALRFMKCFHLCII